MAFAERATSSISVTRETFDDVECLADEWNALAGDAPFRSHEWLVTWWRHFGVGRRELFVVTLRDPQQRLIGLAPWYLDRLPRRGRVIRFLGSDAACSEYLTVLCAQGYERAVPTQLALWLTGSVAHDWDLLEFTSVPQNDAALRLLVSRLAGAGHQTHERSGASCWRSELPADWETFLANLSSRRRQKTRTLLRRSIDDGRIQLGMVTNSAELDRVFPQLVDLHQRRRHSLGQEGCFASRQFTDFQLDVSHRLLLSRRLRMLWLEMAGRTIAVQYGLVGGGTVYYYQGGIDPDAADEQPGSLCVIASLRKAIEEGYRVFDFLRGDEAYKASWNTLPVPLVELRVAGRGPVARLRHLGWRVMQKLRDHGRQWKARRAHKEPGHAAARHDD